MFWQRILVGGVVACLFTAGVPTSMVSAVQAQAVGSTQETKAVVSPAKKVAHVAPTSIDTPPKDAIVVANQTQEALRTAIVEAGSQGKEGSPATVWIPAGTYTLNKTILLESHIKIVAHPQARIVAQNWLSADPVLLATDREAQATKYSGGRNIEIIGGIWDLNQPTRMDNECVAFMIKHSDHVIISDVTVTNCQSHMINISGSRDVVVKNSVFKNDNVAVNPTSALEPDLMRREVVHTDFMNPKGEDCVGDSCDGTPAGDVTVTGNVFENVYSAAGTHHRLDQLKPPGGWRYSGVSLMVTDNVFRNVRASAVNLFSMDNAVVRNNKTEGTPAFVFTQLQDARNAVIENNTGNVGSFLIQKESSVKVANMALTPQWDWGIAVQDTSHADFAGISIRNAKQGIVLNGKSTATMTSSSIEGITGNYGVGVRQQSNMRMTDVKLVVGGAAYAAVDVSEKSTLTMTGGSTTGGQIGVSVGSASTANLTNVSVSNVSQNGIRFAGGSNGTVREATVSHTGIDGVNVAENSTILLEKSSIRNTGQDGIKLNGAGSGCRVLSNTLRQIGRVGIWTMNGTRNAQIDNNNVTDTGTAKGAYRWNLASSGGAGNTFSSNCVGAEGVYFADNSVATNNNSNGCQAAVARCTFSNGKSFVDVPANHQFCSDIAWLAGKGITTGWDDGTFRPQDSVTRAAFAAFLYRLAGKPAYTPPAKSMFKDVPTSHQFYKEISWLAKQEVTKGWPDGTFRPEAKIQRDALSAFLYRFAGKPAFTVTKSFKDTAGSEHKTAIDWFASTGISTGWPDGTFRPSNETERAAIAAFLHRYTDKGYKTAR